MSDSLTKPLIGYRITELEAVDSTNNYAIERAQKNAATHGEAVLAYFQTHGKGQRGKVWLGQPHQSIALSVLLDSSALQISRQFAMIALAGTAVFDFFSHHAGDATTIKWPNDIYWNDRKAGGILIESIVKGTLWRWTVIGIGLNINQTAFEEKLGIKAVSLRQITGEGWDILTLAKELCTCLQWRWEQYNRDGFEPILAFYNAHLYKKGEDVMLRYQEATFNATISHVDANGQLHVLVDGKEEVFTFGEVKWERSGL